MPILIANLLYSYNRNIYSFKLHLIVIKLQLILNIMVCFVNTPQSISLLLCRYVSMYIIVFI